jgi:hypothetical protein
LEIKKKIWANRVVICKYMFIHILIGSTNIDKHRKQNTTKFVR